MKVFLGGTCNESTWREELIPMLKCDYFNPVVDDWTEEAYEREEQEKKICDYNLFVITPKMTGVYSIAEVVDLSNKRPTSTIMCVLISDNNGELVFDRGQRKSLGKVIDLVQANGGKGFYSLEEVAFFLNTQIPKSE